ncbi:MAG TPA: NUDIX domain-containing protein [Acetobacteraceae bacterium]|nr:NUDIX domain-containing protein [Acetobacteraceae bacterium]
MDTLLRHIAACHNAGLPGGRLRLFAGAAPVGWVTEAVAAELAAFGAAREEERVTLADAAALDPAAAAIAARLGHRLRDEAFDVRDDATGAVLGRIDRGALPLFGIRAEGVHLNGLVRRPDGPHLWVARRAAHKALDPSKLDHLVAGGVPAGLTPIETLEKEGAEEAGLPASLARAARPVATISYAMQRSEGLRRDRLHCFDLDLPDDFTPAPHDDEVESFFLAPLPEVLRRARETDDFKFNVNLVLIDLFLREGLVDPASPDGRALRAALDQPGG